MKTALILAGHGSHIRPETAGLVWSHVDALRDMGVADEITAAFWKELPSFHTVINTLTADDITVVPLFTAQGYFTQTVIPAEMGLDGAVTRRGSRLIRYTRTLNEHPYLGEMVRHRVEAALAQLKTAPEQTAIAIIGHSTRRNPESRQATEAQAAALRALKLAAEVQAVYLDDAPEIAAIYTLTHAPNLIAVPYFLASGSHTTIDVPAQLGLKPGQNTGPVNGRTVYYTPPVGTEANLREVILELAREAGAPLYPPASGSPWQGFPAAGREVFLQAVRAAGVLPFGQLRVTLTEVRVWDDTHASESLLTPSQLRARVREQPFRSLATAADLPRGWSVPVADPECLHAVVETIYPGAIADWAKHQQGTFQPNTFAATIHWQTGNYRQLAGLTASQQREITQTVCGHCVRHPTWLDGTSPAGAIPCPEPCNHWLSAALKRLP